MHATPRRDLPKLLDGLPPEAPRAQRLGPSTKAAFRRLEWRVNVVREGAHIAIRPAFAARTNAVLRRWPLLLTGAARLAEKVRRSIVQVA